jgi:hypothetical protein
MNTLYDEARARIDEHLERADDYLQDVVHTWGGFARVGHAKSLEPAFNALFDLANAYRTARDTADNRRLMSETIDSNILSDAEAAKEVNTRRAFVEAYIDYLEQHQIRGTLQQQQ